MKPDNENYQRFSKCMYLLYAMQNKNKIEDYKKSARKPDKNKTRATIKNLNIDNKTNVAT